VEADKDGLSVGFVVLHRGKVAWAVCRNQPETLGTFLWRLGRITRAQLDEINKLYMAHEGRRKLGSLLEDAGYVSRPVLRRCLLLHTRRAVGCLLSEDALNPVSRKGALEVAEENLFALEEVMPHLRYHPKLAAARGDSKKNSGRILAKDHPLAGFGEIPGYLASAVVSADGAVMLADTPDGQVDPSLLGVLLVTVLEASSRAVVPTSLGAINFLLLDCDQGTLVARWVDTRRRYLAALLLSPQGNPGMAKYRINDVLPALEQWLAARGGALCEN
jgi:predicted regulator of Ras-like GTPase activity (Roadblock/LC7/MglB family)